MRVLATAMLWSWPQKCLSWCGFWATHVMWPFLFSFFGAGEVQQWTLVAKCLRRNFNNSFSQHIKIRYLWKIIIMETIRLQKASGIITVLVPELLGLSWLPKETTGTDREAEVNCINWVVNEASGARKYMKSAQWKTITPLNLRWNVKQCITFGQLRSPGLAPSPSNF